MEKYVSLPGNVLVTIKPDETDLQKKTTYSLPNIHGDIFATTNTSGTLASTHSTGPFGELLPNQNSPQNTASSTTWNYLGQYKKPTESDFGIAGGLIQMGARVYTPALGRFLSVDPQEGGTDNNYVYANDPVNDKDLDGRAIQAVGAIIAAIVFCTKACPAMLKSLNAALKSAQAAEKARRAEAARKAAQEAAKRALNNAISRWSNKAILESHFRKHGASMGYKNMIDYTNGALSIVRGSGTLLKSGSRAYVSGNRVTLMYNGKVASHFISSNVQNWLRNNRR